MYLIKRYFKANAVQGDKRKNKVRKYDIAIRIHDKQLKKFPGDRSRINAMDIGRRIEALIHAKRRGDEPPGTLSSWIENMPEGLANRLIALRLIDKRRRDQNQPLETLIDEFYSAVASRKGNKERSARCIAGVVRRICTALGFQRFSELNEEKINKWLMEATVPRGERKGQPLSTRWRREYIVCLKSFANWMIDSDRALKNPIAKMKAPGPREQPVRQRRPLTLDESRNLLGTVDKADAQTGSWGALDRKMFYWTLIKTGIRHSEARNIRCFHLDTTSRPAMISVDAAYAKNKTLGRIPIPNDLAMALGTYTAGRLPDAPLFPLPEGNSVRKAFYADLEAAGIPKKNERGEHVDIHSLRHTAITHWLTVDGLTPKDVQFFARLKSIRLVDTYSICYRPSQFPHLDNSPPLFPPRFSPLVPPMVPPHDDPPSLN